VSGPERGLQFDPQFGLGDIDQISFAVRNLEEAVPRYEAMFGGPFAVLDVADMDVVVRGRPSVTSLRLGFGRSAGLEVELVEVVSGDWPTLTWLDEHGEGLHHIRYPVADAASKRAELEAAGATTVLEGGGEGYAFVYLESPHLNGMVIELLQMAEPPAT
jgi:catechol 2,3-dioxygenase-like lactoylglutathione lyase family enzyme